MPYLIQQVELGLHHSGLLFGNKRMGTLLQSQAFLSDNRKEIQEPQKLFPHSILLY
ncbi:hypothetical protein [Carnobacterium iners]|uniref:hypothetical protein n=1 Tax=Carnobacterium iners TaxID=1073423 RepID=UPI0015A63CA1|nr:hypothetical protein [Carnobacterium iners]